MNHMTRQHRPIAIGIADRHPLFAAMLAVVVHQHWPQATIRQMDLVADLVHASATPWPDVLLVDMALPGLGGGAGLLRLSTRHPKTRLIVVCDDLPADAWQLLAWGAMAGIGKSASPEHFADVIDTVLQGRCWLPDDNLDCPYCALREPADLTMCLSRLSARRQLIVERIADGLLNKQIAYELGLRESTIKAHVSGIMKTLRLRNRTQIAVAVNQQRQQRNISPAMSDRTKTAWQPSNRAA